LKDLARVRQESRISPTDWDFDLIPNALGNSRDNGSKFASGRTLDLVDFLNFNAHFSKALPKSLPNQFLFPFSEALCHDHAHSYKVQLFLNDLTFQHMREVNEKTVEAHSLATIWANEDIFSTSNQFLKNGQLVAAARAFLSGKDSDVAYFIADQGLSFAQQPGADDPARFTGSHRSVMLIENLRDSKIGA
jgi:hypothetical protein